MAKEFLDQDGLTRAFTKVKAQISTELANQGITTAGTGAAYTATVDGITALAAGATFVMLPHVTSTSKTATLNVNGLGAKMIRRRVSNSTVTTVTASSDSWLYKNKPIRVTYDGTYWVADMDRPNATDIYGTVPVASGGTGVTTLEALKELLGIVSAEELVQQVITALGTPVFGTVDDDNNIILTGELEPGTYTLKYEDAEGNRTDIGTVAISASGNDSAVIPLNLKLGKIDTSTGNFVDDSNNQYLYSDLVEIADGETYNLSWTDCSVAVKVCYYDASGAYMSSSDELPGVGDTNVLTSISTSVPLIDGASYFRLRVYCYYYNSGYAESVELAKANMVLTTTDTDANVGYTNKLKSAIASDGTPFNNGQGYMAGYRLNSSGAQTAQAGASITGFIPARIGDVVYLSDITLYLNGKKNGYGYVWLYDENFNVLQVNSLVMGCALREQDDQSSAIAAGSLAVDSNNILKQFTINKTTFYSQTDTTLNSVRYIRISADSINENSIVSVNYPIE